MNFIEEFKGIVVCYYDLEIPEEIGQIYYDKPHVNFSVKAKFLVFTPEVGQILVGQVNKVGHDHIGLLVHGVFNVTIADKDLSTRFEYDDDAAAWIPKQQQPAKGKAKVPAAEKSPIQMGTMILFQVTGLQQSDEYFSMLGSLDGPKLGVVSQAAAAEEDAEADAREDEEPQEAEPVAVSPIKIEEDDDDDKPISQQQKAIKKRKEADEAVPNTPAPAKKSKAAVVKSTPAAPTPAAVKTEPGSKRRKLS